MAMKPWMPLVAAMVLAVGLAGCGNGDDEPAPAQDEQVGQATDQPAAETGQASGAAESSAQGQQPAAPDSAAAPDQADAAPGEGDAASGVDLEGEGEVDVQAETLGESPADTLDEDAALPGETTRSDVDAIIEATERRFEEASRRIDEQFENAEKESIKLEPMESPEFAPMEASPELEPMEASPELEPMESSPAFESDSGIAPSGGSELDEQQALPGESSRSDVEAIIKETEKRFEEASRVIDEQFEEAERQVPGTSSDLDALEPDNSDGASDGTGN
ncbi:hypothetical protein [Halomonas sp. 25-S5]|uniref:LptM family lipoprotein n=1 Tax=Halomonas sp. 25-S5 TaxID=2994065 RepID=UPI002468DB89|nr:hypothetical protein [Halomonas sp. 25-S5]